MKSHLLRLSLIAALACATTAALAENPFAGTWKPDYSKSHVTGQALTFTSLGNSQVKYSEGSDTYTFTPNGSDTQNSFGDKVQWKQSDDHTWKCFTKEGDEIVTDTYVLSGDAKTMEETESGTRPNGSAIDTKISYARIAPGKNFYGKWKSTRMENNSPTTAKIDANGDDGIIWNIPEIKASVTLKFDGKDVSPVGPTVPQGLTLAATKVGARSFELTEKENGKVIYRGRYTVSADGNTMTVVGSVPGAAAPTKVVYQKS